MRICEYGCKREATFLLKFKTTDDKWCCEDRYTKCPGNRKKYGSPGSENPMFGKKHSENTKKKIAQSKIGHTPWNKDLKNCHNEEALKKISEKGKGKIPWNKGKTGVYTDETLEQMSKQRKGRIPWNKGNISLSGKSKVKSKVEPITIFIDGIVECEYGCGKEAKHQFKNGKWCCSDHVNKCIKLKSVNDNRIRKFSDEVRKKISESHKGNNYWLGKKHSEESKRKIGDKSRGRKHSEESKRKIRMNNRSEERKIDIETIRKKYPTFSKIEEIRYNPDKPEDKEIQVHCKNHKCPNSKERNGWFTSTGGKLSGRIFAIEKENGNDGAYLYCSDECKKECPLYGLNPIHIINQDNSKEYYTVEEYTTWRNEVLKRANNICEYCGQPVEHIHHIKPQKLEPFFSLDPDYGLACCETCHYKYGHKNECSTSQLAQIICI